MAKTKNIINIIKEREIINEEYLTIKQIKKALNNIGFFYREDYINKTIRKSKEKDIVVVYNDNEWQKRYKINKSQKLDF